MPELPEVEIWRENLERWLKGRQIKEASVPDALLRGGQTRRKVEAALRDATIDSVSRRGKFLVLDLGQKRLPVLVHLGMTGTFERVPKNAELPKFTRVCLSLSRGVGRGRPGSQSSVRGRGRPFRQVVDTSTG